MLCLHDVDSIENILMVRLHTAINLADFVSWCMSSIRKKITKGIREGMTMYFRGEPLHYIRQNTKSARLIAVCKRSFRVCSYGGETAQ